METDGGTEDYMKLPFRVFRVMTVLAVASIVLIGGMGGVPADAAPAGAGEAGTARAQPWKTLRAGDREYRVASVRCLLEQYGFFRDGCKPLTDAGRLFPRGMVPIVQRYQRARRIDATGQIGPRTWEALSRDFRLARQGDRRAELVRGVQYALKILQNRNLRVDGIFGPDTDRTVRAYQRRKMIHVDGIVGPVTFRTMYAMGAGSKSA
jgi:peptidoglycan hydrolase-like protein with peptidoglycan-binding domain